MSEESSSKGQKLRDKLSMTLKQRLGRSDSSPPSGADGPPPVFGGGDSAIFLTPDQVSDSGDGDERRQREDSFLQGLDAGVESAVEMMSDAISDADKMAADVESSLIDELTAFASDHAGALNVTDDPPGGNDGTAVPVSEAKTAEPESKPAELTSAPESDERKQKKEPPPIVAKENNASVGPKMTEDNDKKDGSSLRELIKGKSGGGGKQSTLRAPSQKAHREDEPVESEGSESRAEEAPQAPQKKGKESSLRAPRAGRQSEPESSSGDEPTLPPAEDPRKIHEKEVFEAVKTSDVAWIQKYSDASLFPHNRQEIILAAADNNAPVVLALLDAGFSFDPKCGYAVRMAASKGYWNVVDIYVKTGAVLDKPLSAKYNEWISSSDDVSAPSNPFRGAVESDEAEATVQSEMSSDDLDAEFAKFLEEHGTIDMSEPESEPESPVVLVGSDTGRDSVVAEPEPMTPAAEEPQTVEPEHHDEPERSDSRASRRSERGDARRPADTARTRYSERTRPQAQTSPAEPQMTTLEKAKMKTMDALLAEKQTLEKRVLELMVYQEAAEELERERNDLAGRVEEMEGAIESLEHELDDIDKESTETRDNLESVLAENSRLERELSESIAARDAENKRAKAHESDLADMLADGKAREKEMEARISELEAEVDELRNAPLPLPEFIDFLAGTDDEAEMLEHPFIQAAADGNIEIMESVSNDERIPYDIASNAIIFAAETGNLDSMAWILRNLDADIHVQGELPLHRAMAGGHIDSAIWLMERGADFHKADEFVLRHAARENNVGLIIRLVELGANVHAGGERPLEEAAMAGAWDAARVLMAFGANPCAPDGSVIPVLDETEDGRTVASWGIEQAGKLRSLDPDFAKFALMFRKG